MDYVNYYIIALITFLHIIHYSNSITNQGPQSSIPKDFKRHIGLAPETNWEPGLREAAHQTLLKEHVTLSHLRERILKAPMSGPPAKVSPFGDVAILARGQLFATNTGFRFVQDPHPNDCIDCHELRQCYGKECEIYLRNGLGERLIALWTVKRLRHRHPDVRYELEYSVSPIRKHVWVTKNGGYDYSIPGHVFVVKVMSHYGELPHYPHPAVPPKVHSNKHPYPGKPLTPGEWVQTKPSYGNKPLVAPPYGPEPGKIPNKIPGKIPNQLPNYYLPQKRPEDQKTSTTIKDIQPTLDYAEIEAYKNLLQVLHQRTSTTKIKPGTKLPSTQVPSIVTGAGTLPTRPPLSHTTWFIPIMTSTLQTKPTSLRPSSEKPAATTTWFIPSSKPSSTTSTLETKTTSLKPTSEKPAEGTTWFIPSSKPSSTTSTLQTKATSLGPTNEKPAEGTTWFIPSSKPSSTSTKPSPQTSKTSTMLTSISETSKPTSDMPITTKTIGPIPQTSPTSPQITKSPTATRPQTIYQQLGGFDSSTSKTKPTTLAMTTYSTSKMSTIPQETVRYPIKTTTPMEVSPSQQGLTKPSSIHFEPTKPRETTRPITLVTERWPRPTQPMTPSERPTRPTSQTGTTGTKPFSTRPSQTTFFTRPETSTDRTRPMSSSIGTSSQTGLTPSKPGTTESRPRPTDGQTTSTFLFATKVTPPFGLPSGTTKPGYGTTQMGTTFPVTFPQTRYPTSRVPGTTYPGSTFQGPTIYGTDTTIPFRGTQPNTITTSLGTVTDQGTTFVGTSGTSTKYPTTQYLPAGTTVYTKPTRPTSEPTFGTTFGTTFFPGPITTQRFPETKPTGLLESTKVTYPQTTDYQHPIPTFFIDPTHPGYPKTTPTTPFTDGESFKPSQPDPFFHPEDIPSLTHPSTIHTPPTTYPTKPSTTLSDFVNTDTNGNTIEETGTGTTLLIPAPTDRYTPPATAHTITLPTKLPKPSTPFFRPPAVDDYEAELFPKDPNEPKTTTTTEKPEVIPTGDFILPEEDYKPHVVIPDLNQQDPTVFNQLAPTSTTERPTSTINPIEIEEVFDSATLKPKPSPKIEDFDDFFKQTTQPTTIIPTTQASLAKVIYSDFFEASTITSKRVLESFTTPLIPNTSQSFSTSVSVQIGKNQQPSGKVRVKKLKFRKASVKELPSKESYKIYEAEQPKDTQSTQLTDVHISPSNPSPSPQSPKYGPNGRKYKKSHKFKPSTTPSSVTFDDLALQLVNHARTIDYLDSKPTQETSPSLGSPKISRSNTGSNTNPQNRNKYRRKSYGRVRKVKKRPETKAVITRTNRGATKASQPTEDSKGKDEQEILKTAE